MLHGGPHQFVDFLDELLLGNGADDLIVKLDILFLLAMKKEERVDKER